MLQVKEFIASESGAITVDWVVLTAGMVGLGIATMVVVTGGVEDVSEDTAASLRGIDTNGMFDWTSSNVMVNSGWGDLSIFSPRQSASGAESYVNAILNSHGGDYQAAYDQLYQQALDMTYADGESVDDFGAFEAMAAANGAEIETGDNMNYAEMHAIYEANGSL